jgi:hypothetical protein
MLLLLLLETLSCIVTHLSTNKASHCAHVSLRLTAPLSSLWWGPKLGTLLTSLTGLFLALCPKSKVLITLHCLLLLLLLLSKGLCYMSSLLLDEVIPHPLPCSHNLLGNNVANKWTPRFGKVVQSCPHHRVGVHHLSDGSKLVSDLGVEDFPGPIKLPTRSVFDLKLALSFNCQ